MLCTVFLDPNWAPRNTFYSPKCSWIGNVETVILSSLISEWCSETSTYIPFSIHCSNPTGSWAALFSTLKDRTGVVNRKINRMLLTYPVLCCGPCCVFFSLNETALKWWDYTEYWGQECHVLEVTYSASINSNGKMCSYNSNPDYV